MGETFSQPLSIRTSSNLMVKATESANRGLPTELFGNLTYVVTYVLWVRAVRALIVALDDQRLAN